MIHSLPHLVHTYGYSAVALVVGLECAGVILPGETVLVIAALAAAHGHLKIGLVIAAAVAGAVVGNLIGFGIGRFLGHQVLMRHGWRVGLTCRRLSLGRYLYARHGGIVVFFCRYAAVLRSFSGLLAGANEMAWRPFVAWSVVGAIAWACSIGLTAFWLGNKAKQLTGTASLVFAAVAVVAIGLVFYLGKRNEHRLTERALAWERASGCREPAET